MVTSKGGKYWITEGSPLLEDPDSGEKILFMLDSSNTFVIRSMLEEDIDCIKKMKKTHSELRTLKRMLYQELPRKGSQFIYYLVEKNVSEAKRGWTKHYKRKRETIGIGILDIQTNMLNFSMFPGYDSDPILSLMKQVGAYCGIKNPQSAVL